MRIIRESTAVSISLLIAIIGGAVFIVRASFQGEANASAIQKLESKQTAIEQIQTDIAVIKTKLESIEKSLPNQRHAIR